MPMCPTAHRPKTAVCLRAKHMEKFSPAPLLLLTFATFKGKIKQKLCKKINA
jgi:hypothetical protein